MKNNIEKSAIIFPIVRVIACLFMGMSIILMTKVAMASDIPFTRSLKMGMIGEDVRELQRVLNKDENTMIAKSGPGSSGNETTYFGGKTALAVIKFQEKYADQVLAPVGLLNGTGYVGSWTLAKLNEIHKMPISDSTANLTVKNQVAKPLNNDSTVNSQTNVGSQNNSGSSQQSIVFSDEILRQSLIRGVLPQWAAFGTLSPDDLAVFGLSHINIKPGDTLSIVGLGFIGNTTVNIGQDNILHIVATSSQMINLQIPSIPYGNYPIWITNARGTTKNNASFFITVGSVTDTRPNILSVYPASASRGDTINVTADKLDSSGNTIYSSLGIIRSVSSTDGRTLNFKIDDLPNASAFFQNKTVNKFIVTFSIGTQSSKSSNYGYFTIIK